MISAERTSTERLLPRIYEMQELSRQEKSVACAILATGNSLGECRATMKEMAKITEYCDKSLGAFVTSMENKGFLTRTQGHSPDTGKDIIVFRLHFPDKHPDPTEVSSPAGGELSSDSPAKTESLSGNGREISSGIPHNRQLASTELKDLEPKNLEPKNLEPKDLEPKALDPKGQEQGQNPKHTVTPPHALFPRKPSEDRQSPAKNAQGTSSISANFPPRNDPEDLGDLPKKVLELYGLLCSNLPPADRLTAKRTLAVQALIREIPQGHSPDWWENYFARAAGSSFLTGSGPRRWKTDLDWLLIPGNAKKVLAGNYDAQSTSRPRGIDESVEEFVDRMVAELEREIPDDD